MDLNSLSSVRRRIATSSKRQALGSSTIRCAFDVVPFLMRTSHTSAMEIESQEPIVIPHRELSAGALRGVLESFVLREGTEYGEHEVSLDEKVAQVLLQLERGEAQVIFNAALESIDIVMSKPNLQRSS